jgi:holo-[acyl-carrier-protein] synthase
MIIGLGSDLIDIRRIAKTIRATRRKVSRSHLHATGANEIRQTHAARAASYAKRFAAKEACSKALGTGLRKGVFWRDMGVVNLPGGKPTMTLVGRRLTPPKRNNTCRLRCDNRSDDYRRFSTRAGDRDHFRDCLGTEITLRTSIKNSHAHYRRRTTAARCE